jgi:hypothetical protein
MPGQDRDFLRQYARGSDEYVRAQPSRQSDETLTQYLRRVGVDDSAPTGGPGASAEANAEERTPADAARARANQRQANQAAMKDAQLAAAEEARKQKAKNSMLIGKGLYAAGIVPNKAADTVERIQEWIATRPTPGGRGGMLLLLLLFGAFIIPVAAGGYTRAQLFWLTLLGRTELDESGEPDKGEPGRNPPAPTGEPGRKPPVPTGEPRATGGGPKPLPFTLPLHGSNGPSLTR